MRIIVMTQQDRFYIPRNIEKAIAVSDVLEIINVDYKHSLENKTLDFLRWFGIWQALKMSVAYSIRIISGIIDSLTGYRIFGGYCSVAHIARKHKIPYKVVNNVNDPAFFEHIKELNPELIISYSAPQVIKEPLLSYPRHGIINVHSSLLPDYRGCMPSFWVLYNGETHTGATVHFMAEKIDDGKIIIQDRVSIEGCKSMVDVMRHTKQLGGQLVVKAISLIQNNAVEPKPNIAEHGRYFTWPNRKQGRDFIKSGKSLI